MAKSPGIRIGFYAFGDKNTGSTWFRLMQFFPYLKYRGLDIHFYPLPTVYNGRLKQIICLFVQAMVRFWQLLWISRYDLVVIQKGLTPWRCRWLIGLLLKSKIPFIFDFDDSIHLTCPILLPPYARWLQDTDEASTLLRKAASVMAGNRYLAEASSQLNRNVYILPTCFDTAQYTAVKKRGGAKAVIGWSGSVGTNIYVNAMLPIFSKLKRLHDFSFLVISNNLQSINVREFEAFGLQFIPWRKETEVQDLQRIDIGIMPLPDDPWAKGKCGGKILQYMAIGIAAVSSPVGVNCEIVENGVNGYLASDESSWVHMLGELIEDAKKRERFGAAARKTVEERYSLESNQPRLLEMIHKTLEENFLNSWD